MSSLDDFWTLIKFLAVFTSLIVVPSVDIKSYDFAYFKNRFLVIDGIFLLKLAGSSKSSALSFESNSSSKPLFVGVYLTPITVLACFFLYLSLQAF